MAIKIKKVRKRYAPKPLDSLSQKEIINRINRSTRNSYKYFNLLLNRL